MINDSMHILVYIYINILVYLYIYTVKPIQYINIAICKRLVNMCIDNIYICSLFLGYNMDKL